MESTIYKIKKSKRYSSIFYGPITMVYGFGIVLLLLTKRYFLDKIKISKKKKILLTFISCVIVLTLTEWLGGNILSIIFKIDMWNYTNKKYHFGKYICLELSLIWGVFGTLYIYFIKDFTDKILNLFSKKFTYTLILINLIDAFFVFINKLPNR